MKVGYIDTDFLLSILLEDDNYQRSVEVWNSLDMMFSSITVEVEARTNLYRYFLPDRRDSGDYNKKEKALNGLLENINRKMVDEEIMLEIKNTNKLKKLSTIEAIHLATANIINRLMENKIVWCSYDQRLATIAKDLGFDPIQI